MNHRDVLAVLDRPISRELLASPTPARLAYTGLDGAPRVIPIGYWWTGEHIEMATLPASAKVRALRADPRVAITVDTLDPWPPRALLVRGTARLEHVSGVPDSYVAAGRKAVPAEQFADWEQSVRALYEAMVLITVTPEWAKLLDFETTLPKSVEDLMRAHPGA